MASRKIPLPPPRVFSPTINHPMVDDFTLRALRHQAKNQPPGVQPVHPMTLRRHAMWDGSNELGREVPFAPAANNSQMVLKMEEWGEPQIWTVSLGLDYARALTPATAFSVLAQILFGSGGVTQTIEVDWLQGSSVTLPANTITVNATYPFQGIPGVSTPPDLVLRASVGKRPNGKSRPTRSYRVEFPSTVTNVTVPVPPFAKNVWINFPVTVAGITRFAFHTNVIATFAFSTDTLVGLAAAAYTGTQFLTYIDFANELLGAPMPLPVPEGARTLGLVWAPGGTPANPPSTFNVNVQFELGL
jgi:hypothetical protein